MNMERDARIPELQGFMAVSPNAPNPKGLLFFTEEAALRHKQEMEDLAATYPEGFSGEYWKEKPEPWQVFALRIEKRIA